MMIRPFLPASRATLFSLVCLLVVAMLVMSHARTIGGLRADVIPLSADIPALEQRLEVLFEQLKLTEMQQALRTSTPEESMRVYILPRELDLDRLVSSVETLENALRATQNLRAMSLIEFLEAATLPSPVEGLQVHPFHVRLSVTKEGLVTLLRFIDLAGSLTISDTLSDKARERLLQASEAESPSSIVALEQFLRTDLLVYAKDAKSYAERLKQSFSSEQFLAVLDGTLQSSLLPEFVELLQSDLGASIALRNLWPLPFLSISSISVTQAESEWRDVELEVWTFTRVEK